MSETSDAALGVETRDALAKARRELRYEVGESPQTDRKRGNWLPMISAREVGLLLDALDQADATVEALREQIARVEDLLHLAATAGWTITHDATTRSKTHHAREVLLERDDEWLSLHTYVVSHRTWFPPFRFRARQVYAETAATANLRYPLIEWEGDATALPADPTNPDIDTTTDLELQALFTAAIDAMQHPKVHKP